MSCILGYEMNDFTKEELIDLYHAIRFFYRNRGMYDLPSDNLESQISYAHELMEKIQGMIDNYCEHTNLDDYDLFLPKVGALLTDEQLSASDKIKQIKTLYLATVFSGKNLCR